MLDGSESVTLDEVDCCSRAIRELESLEKFVERHASGQKASTAAGSRLE